MSSGSHPTYRTFVGIAKETTHGTAAASTDYLPVTKFEPEDKATELRDQGMRGSMTKDYGVQLGNTWSEVSAAGDVFADTIPYLLGGVLGDYTYTAGSGTPNSHALALLNTGGMSGSSDAQPTSHTWTDNNTVQVRRWPGQRVSELTVKFDAAGLLTWDAKLLGFPSVPAGGLDTSSWSTLPPVPSWQGILNINGTAVPQLESGEISFKRNGAKPIPNIDGTQAPYKTHLGDLTVAAKATFIADSEAQLDHYLNGDQLIWNLAFSNGKAGTALTTVQVVASQVVYLPGTKKTIGKEYIEVEVVAGFMANPTDQGSTGGESPCKATVKNLRASGIYV
jgi:hypothetical protein